MNLKEAFRCQNRIHRQMEEGQSILELRKRKCWSGVAPVTRKPEHSRAYVRRKAQARKNDPCLRF